MKIILIALAALLLCATSGLAQTVHLSWDPTPSPEATGYKIYYIAQPFAKAMQGTGAAEGTSPSGSWLMGFRPAVKPGGCTNPRGRLACCGNSAQEKFT